MSRAHDLLARDISLWLSGETIGEPADRAVAELANDAAVRRAVRRAVCAAIAVEDLVRDWYSGIPLPPLEPAVIERERRRSLVSAGISAVAASLAMAFVAASVGRPLDRAVDAAEAWAKSGPPLPLATTSLSGISASRSAGRRHGPSHALRRYASWSIRECQGLEGEPVPIERRRKPSAARIVKRGFLRASGGHEGRSERPPRWHG